MAATSTTASSAVTPHRLAVIDHRFVRVQDRREPAFSVDTTSTGSAAGVTATFKSLAVMKAAPAATLAREHNAPVPLPFGHQQLFPVLSSSIR